ncbi:class I SAM-dependent methyltransferase [Morganella morganii]|uniref:class I SAM-dependent methyltransferase n=1 Tax=Morganella morganii TaxID=582 RepID=UPI001162D47D|nr:class I SAM-dependent methyltransferase [Morganella morganii]QQO74326.1 methyltransferase domain-containing protein [Morganella morganii]
MTTPYDDPLYRDPELAQFYDMDNKWRADFDMYLTRAATAGRILDLGCGTGTLMAAIAEKYPDKILTGADPAAAMLAIAQKKTGRVSWLQASAETLDAGMTYDLIILSGHAFQVFLTREQRIAALQNMQRHLSPDGIVLFDSRNPAAEEWREWIPALSREVQRSDKLGDVISWNDVSEHNGIVRYQTFYQIGENGPVYRAESDIAFPSAAEITEAVTFSGLMVRHIYGDHQSGPFRPDSREMVFELSHPQCSQACAA